MNRILITGVARLAATAAIHYSRLGNPDDASIRFAVAEALDTVEKAEAEAFEKAGVQP